MGKCKRKKFAGKKPRPTGLPSVSECEAEFELTGNAGSTTGALQNIVEKLQSPSEEARECGCATIAGLVSEPGAIQQLMKLGVLKILAPLMLDNSLDVRCKALGALRNVSVDGGLSICEEMVKKDVMTPLVALFHQFGKGGDFREDVKLKQKDLVMETYTQAVYLLLNLCESSGLAVSIFNKENLWLILSPMLISTDCSDSLKVAVAQCLYTVTEDNPELSSTGVKDTIKKSIAADGNTSELVLVRTLSMGILVNMEGSRLPTGHGDLVVPMVTALGEVLGIDVLAVLLQKEAEENGDMECSAVEKKIDKNSERHKETALENLLSAQKVALEIVANLCCSEDDGWEDMSNSESSSDDVSDDVTNDVTDEPMEDNNNCEMSLCVPTELHTAYVSCGIVQKVLNLAQPLTQEQLQLLDSNPTGKATVKRFSSRQTHALLCLNNLFGSLDTAAFGGVEKLYPVWQGLVTLSKDQNCIESQELLEAITSAMRALIQKLTEEDSSKFSEVSPSDLQFLFEMSLKCQWSDVRVNSLRIVSTIGALIAKSLQINPLLKDVGLFLVEVVSKDTDLWVVAEALDAIFDVFGEDHLDPVVKEIGLVEKLKSVAPVLKSKALRMNYSPILYAKIRAYLLTSTDSRLHNYESRSNGAVPNFWMCTLSQAPENHYDEVYPGIYMGDFTLAQNKRGLLELGISHIVNCSQGSGSRETNTDARYYRDVGIKYHGMKALDLPTYNMMPHFKAASDFIEKALKKGGKVFIHCYKGVSRSATILIAYLMMKCNIDLEEAVKMIRAKRKIHPNDGFIRQLCILSRQLYGAKFE